LSIFTRALRAAPQPGTDATAADGGTAAPKRRRPALAVAATVLAALFLLVALLVPNSVGAIRAGAFARLPLEGIAGLGLLIALPRRVREPAAMVAGAGLGLLTIVKVLDMGFWAALNRQFDLVADWGLLDDAFNVLVNSLGRPAAIAGAVAAGLVVLALPVVLAWSVLRLARVGSRRRPAASRVVASLAAAWVVCALLGVQVVPGVPVASDGEAVFVRDRAALVRQGVRDQRAFAAAQRVDAFRNTPGDRLLTGLRGHDVVFSVVESYGRSAIEDPAQARIVEPVLTAGARQLKAAGYTARSGFLTSPTFGGYSWLAHSTYQTGLQIDNQLRYRNIVTSDRLSLTRAFKNAGWQTVAVEPDNTYTWPEGSFYGYDRVWDERNLGYRGPHFSASTMPDQYTLAAFARDEYARPHPPMMAEVTLTSSHTPWAPLPSLVDWNAVGDGSLYTAQAKAGFTPQDVWGDPARVRTEYARSIAYSVASVLSFVTTYGKDNLVLVYFGDHQASSNVSGAHAGHDVPVTIIAKDPAVLARLASWGWQDGLEPSRHAPVWPMSSFRDRFLTTFGPATDPAR
jgi:Sulfatase